jgi:uncharacterized protein YdiU (UPF0061 family)
MIADTEMSETGWKLENSYADLPEKFFTSIKPDPVSEPKLIILNHTLAADLGLNAELLQEKDGVEVLAGNRIPEGSFPIAQAYAGHQFGHFTMLGDGRAVLLGEQVTPSGTKFDIQLKGSGRTPYSRGGDGRATLGPMLREYIISEAMHGLGIPTTRSLAVVTTGESVIREKLLPGAILTRVAASHIRVGTFQYAANWCTVEELQELADYTINRHFPEAADSPNPYLSLLEGLVRRQAILIAKWQLVGFVHGVMNTDNMSISGETIDYGPCAFMDTYDPDTVFSSIDIRGRYAYGNQPDIGAWNLARFADSLLPLINENQKEAVKDAEAVVSNFSNIYKDTWLNGMRAKLGIFNSEAEDEQFIEELLRLMEEHKADYTNTFLALTFDEYSDSALFNSNDFKNWHAIWQSRLERQEESEDESHQLMRDNNPAVIPRNHRVEEALENAVEKGNYSLMVKLIDVLSNPFAHSAEQAEYSKVPEPSGCPYRTFCGT